MSWLDFGYYPSSAQIDAFLDPLTPIAGVSSLSIRRVSGAASCALNWGAGPGLARGKTHGTIRCRVHPLELFSNSHQFGLLSMFSQHDLTSAGSCYALRMRGDDLDLVKYTAGLAASGSILVTVAGVLPGSWEVEQVIQLDWAADQQDVLGGTYLRAWHALGTDFGALAEVAAWLDTSAPLSTSVNEGGFAGDFGAGFNFSVLFDSLRVELP